MVFIDLGDHAEKCHVIANGDGTESYQKVSNGQLFCVTDTLAIEERPVSSAGGPFESFNRTSNAIVADRPWNGVQRARLFPYAEVK